MSVNGIRFAEYTDRASGSLAAGDGAPQACRATSYSI